VIDGGTITRNVPGRIVTNNLASWRNSWWGRPAGGRVQVVTGSRVIREIVGERVIDIAIIPFMRSIKVNFRAQGLRPNTRFFAFFGNVRVDDWVRTEASYTVFAQSSDDIGNVYTQIVQHPDGPTNLVSSADGTINGSFVIPSRDNLRFRTGPQIFKLLDISVDDENAATSIAKATFFSSGTIETSQRTIRSTRQLDLQFLVQGDPLAQSFRVDQIENPSGIFLSKVRLYFATRDTSVPVQVQIRTVENGIPSGVPMPGAVKFLTPADISLPANTDQLASVQAAPTDFVFDEPVYLAPGQEYAIVVRAESTDYNVYVAKTYDFVPWNPDQTRDMMFQLFRADFSPSANLLLENASTPRHLLENNPFQMDSGDSDIRVFHTGHGFVKNDRVFIGGLNNALTYAGIPGEAINGTRVITEVDHSGYKFGARAGDQATSTLRVGGDGVIVSKNIMFNSFIPVVTTLTPDNVTLNTSVKLTEGASFGDIQGGRNADANGAYSKDASFTSITLNELNDTQSAKLIASDSNETVSLGGAKSFSLLMNLSTIDTKVSPVIDLQRAGISTFENLIDNQDSASTTGFNVPISFVPETHPTSGSSTAKHITSQITLAEQAVGLKILFSANRPTEAGFKVYIKTAQSDTVLDTLNWIEVSPESTLPSDDDGATFRQYEYLAGGTGGNLTPFTIFQVKLVMTSTNSSKIPTVKDLRVIALAT